MTIVYQNLQTGGDINVLGSSVASVSSNNFASTSYITQIILHNTNSTTEKVELWNVPDNATNPGTPTDANKFWCDDVAADETIMITLPKPGIIQEDPNDAIFGKSTTASKVTVQILGAVVT